jgi:hypothetical protein
MLQANRMVSELLDKTSKRQVTKAKINKWIYIKPKTCTSKETIIRVKK